MAVVATEWCWRSVAICSGGGNSSWWQWLWVIGRGSGDEDGALWQLVETVVQRC